MKPTLVRTAVSGGALALTLGVAAPALACVASHDTGAKPAMFTGVSDPGKHSSHQTLTLAELQAKVDAWLAAKIDRLGTVRDRVSDSTKLTDEQKADFLALIDAKVAKLEIAREAVAAATSKAEVKAAVKAAGLDHLLRGHRHHGWGWFGGHAKSGHHDWNKGDWNKGDRHGRSDKADPGRWDGHSGSTRAVTVSWHNDSWGHSRHDSRRGESRYDSHRGDSHRGGHGDHGGDHGGDRGGDHGRSGGGYGHH